MKDYETLEYESSLDKNICQDCGLSLQVYSYPYPYKEKANSQEKKYLHLTGKNGSKLKNKIEYEEYFKLYQNKLLNTCKCCFCNNYININENPIYCHNCKKIICYNCSKNKHPKEHQLFNYSEIQNKCLFHCIKQDEKCIINFFCTECKKNMCEYCKMEDFEHSKNNKIKDIKTLELDKKDNIDKIRKETEELKKKKDALQENIVFNEIKLNAYKNNFLALNNIDNNSFDIDYFNYLNNNIYDNKKNDLGSNDLNNDNSNNNSINYINNNININNNRNSKNNINNNSSNDNSIYQNVIINNMYINQNKNKTENIIYHDENLTKFCNTDKDKILEINAKSEQFKDLRSKFKDTKFMEKIVGTIILTYNKFSLELVLKYILGHNSNCKFAFIVNGKASEETFKFLKENNYMPIFNKGSIYTKSKEISEKVMLKFPDFCTKICLNKKDLTKFIDSTFKNSITEKFYTDTLIDNQSFSENYKEMKKVLYSFTDTSKEKFKDNLSVIENLFQKEEFGNCKEIIKILMSSFQIFSEVMNKNYEKIISYYLDNYYFSKILNLLLNKKDMLIYKKIGYFAGILIHSLIEYGKNKNKQIEENKTFYNGMQLNIIELLEYLKNVNNRIAFPYFFSMTTKKDLAELSSKRNISSKEREENEIFSVIFTIKYYYDVYSQESNIIEVKDLSADPKEEEYILLPFNFLYLSKIKIDSNNFTADIDLEITKEIYSGNIKEVKKEYMN